MPEYCAIRMAGSELWLHGSKMLWIPEHRLLCAADIHFGKATFFRRFATLLPPYDTRETLGALAHWVEHFQPLMFLALGDSFHDAKAGERLDAKDRRQLNAIIASVPRWVWITGNHDPDIAVDIAGERRDEMTIAEIAFRHEWRGDSTAPEVSGHFHPKTSVTLRGRRIGGPCFARAGEKLILPSFGSFTGGLDIGHPELQARLPEDTRRIYLTHSGKTYPIQAGF